MRSRASIRAHWLRAAAGLRYAPRAMKASAFDEVAFFRAIAESSVRALLIGRRGLIALGMPVMTRDYDFWIPADDAAALNAALLPFDMLPSRSPDEARKNGRYVLENDEHVDVLVARAVSTCLLYTSPS